jgi:hypothetical protein
MFVMILRDDQIIETFDSPDTPPSWIEWIDVENGEYSFCDDRGQIYEGRLVQPGKLFRAEVWRLVPIGDVDVANAIALIGRAAALDANRCMFPDLESLKRCLES